MQTNIATQQAHEDDYVVGMRPICLQKKGKIGPRKQAALCWQNRGVERKIILVGDPECVY